MLYLCMFENRGCRYERSHSRSDQSLTCLLNQVNIKLLPDVFKIKMYSYIHGWIVLCLGYLGRDHAWPAETGRYVMS